MPTMNESDIIALTAWLAKAGLSGEPEDTLVSGFCDRAVAAGLPISRAQVFIDTLHPVYEGRLVRWGYAPSRPVVQEYGRTGSVTDASAEDIARWQGSPFFHMLQTGENMLHRRVAEKRAASAGGPELHLARQRRPVDRERPRQ